MVSLVFCKISCMKYYKGACSSDTPYNGGSFVDDNGYGHEEFNFLIRNIPADWSDDSGSVVEGKYCLGFVETKHTSGKSNQLHIEKIIGVGDSYKKKSCITGITVIWCATSDLNETTVVGWYKNATVFRNYQSFIGENDEERVYNIISRSSDCVLLPENSRHQYIWKIPSKRYTRTYGFGQSMLWYAQEEKAEPYLKRLLEDINSYTGDNWLHICPEN